MIKKRLGKTEIEVSTLGLGTVKFGRNQGVKYPESFNLPTDAALKLLLRCAQEQGINLIDTAPAYGCSEARLGGLLKGERADWVIVSKAGEFFENGVSRFDFSPKAIQNSVILSLKRLKTDYLDVVLIHSDGQDLWHIQHHEVFETLAQLKKAGWIRAYGMSTKTVEGGLATVAAADVVMVTYRPTYTEEVSVLEAAAAKNTGILIKKALASGHLPQREGSSAVEETFRFIFQQPAVSSVIIGTISEAHLLENVQALSRVET